MPRLSVSRADILKEEYFALQSTVEQFDERALQIKGWSVTVSLAGMAAALISKDVPPDLKSLAFMVAGVASLAFWVIEFSWKRFQWSFYARIRAIEHAFASHTEGQLAPLQIGRSFSQSINKLTFADFFKPFYPFIALPHLAIAVLSFYLAGAFASASSGHVQVFGHSIAVLASCPDGARK